MQTEGEVHQFSCPHMPQKSSVVERKHQHLLNVTRALLFHTKVPIHFLGDCVNAAAFLINRTPSSGLENKSLYERLHNKVPEYAFLRVFGCLCFVATIPTNKNKFTPRATPCVLLGYPSGVRGYKLLVLETRKIMITRDVTFQESIFPFHSITDTNLLPSLFSDTVLPKSLAEPICPAAPNPMDNNEPHESHPDSPVHVPISRTVPCTGHLTLPIEQIEQHRRSSRLYTPPSYLQDFQCNVQYPIQNHLSYDSLHSSYKHFICLISTIYEPSYYHQAISSPEWR